MSNVVKIDTLDQLMEYANEKGIIEIALRNKKKRFKTFEKVIINSLPDLQEKELAQKVICEINSKMHFNERNLRMLVNVAKIGKVEILLNSLNMCTSCAGFAIMYQKLDALSVEIHQHLHQVQTVLKQTLDIHNAFEYNQVLQEHSNMLDCQRKQQPYSEEQLRVLVDREYNLLSLLIHTYQLDVSENHNSLICSIFAMLSMFTVSLLAFDELYYFNNRQVLGSEEPWHLSHHKRMEVFRKTSRLRNI